MRRYLDTPYYVTSCGMVWSSSTGRFLKRIITKNGYYKVSLSLSGKVVTMLVHRMVATCYCDNPDNLPIVNHKDGNKLHCWYKNLEWTTIQGNSQHSIDSGLHTMPVWCGTDNYMATAVEGEINGKWTKFDTITDASRTTGAHRTAISMCCKGKRKSANGIKWRFANKY